MAKRKKRVKTNHHKKILLSIGAQKNKLKLLPFIKAIKNFNFIFYATNKTHHFLEKQNIPSKLVYKISRKKKKPNIINLLNRKAFNIIINIPTHNHKKRTEITDGRIIRKKAIETDVVLITDVEVAEELLKKLYKTYQINHRPKGD